MTQADDILKALEGKGWQTLDQIQAEMQIQRHVLRGRIHGLIADGKVERSGEGRKSKFRAKTIVVSA